MNGGLLISIKNTKYINFLYKGVKPRIYTFHSIIRYNSNPQQPPGKAKTSFQYVSVRVILNLCREHLLVLYGARTFASRSSFHKRRSSDTDNVLYKENIYVWSAFALYVDGKSIATCRRRAVIVRIL